MVCLFPSTIVNPHYVKYPFELENSIVPHDYYITIPCGRCPFCRKKKANEWKFRLLQEIRYLKGKHNKFVSYEEGRSYFVTLTFSERYYNRFKDDVGRAIRLFVERYRKVYGHSLRHWFVTELGGENARLHLHGVIFNPDFDAPLSSFSRVVLKKCGKGKYGRFLKHDGKVKALNKWLRRFWKYGNTWVDVVRPETIGYVVKYILKPSEHDLMFMPRVYASPGLGKSYAYDQTNIDYHLGQMTPIVKYEGSTFVIPMYLWRTIVPEDLRKTWSYDNWLHPPEFRQYLLGVEYTSEESFNERYGAILADYLNSNNVIPRTYIPGMIPLDLLERTFDYADQEYIDAVLRTINNVKEFYGKVSIPGDPRGQAIKQGSLSH